MQLSFGKTIAVLISGKAGVGKSTSATFMQAYLESKGLKVGIFPFATGVKSIAHAMGWDGKKDTAGRKLLIDVGQVGRAYDENTWASMTFDRIIPGNIKFPFDVVIVDDWRFPNEGNYVIANPLYQVFKIRVVSPEREILRGTPFYDDVSETSLPELPEVEGLQYYFSHIFNLTTLDDLKSQVINLSDNIIDSAIKW